MQFLGDMNIKEAIEHCWDRKDYPEVFRDEDYLKRKHGDSFRQLIITRCVPDYFGGANIFNNLFYGRQF